MTDYSLWEVILNGDSSNNTDNTNESVSVVPSVSAASTKPPVSTLPNVDNLSDVVIYSFFASQTNIPQLDNEDLKQLDANYLKEMDLKWQKSRSPRDTRNKDTQRRTVLVEILLLILWCHSVMVLVTMIGASRLMKNQQIMPLWHLPPQTYQVLHCDGVGSYDWSFQTDEEPTNYALMTFTSSSSSSSDNE
nr:hypothetical protein [Tanacetum cinerariifolium]